MRIIEILSFNSGQEAAVYHGRDLPIAVSNDGQNLMQRLSNAFTRNGQVKGLWAFDPIHQEPELAPRTMSIPSSDEAAQVAHPMIHGGDMGAPVSTTASMDPVHPRAPEHGRPTMSVRRSLPAPSGG